MGRKTKRYKRGGALGGLRDHKGHEVELVGHASNPLPPIHPSTLCNLKPRSKAGLKIGTEWIFPEEKHMHKGSISK